MDANTSGVILEHLLRMCHVNIEVMEAEMNWLVDENNWVLFRMAGRPEEEIDYRQRMLSDAIERLTPRLNWLVQLRNVIQTLLNDMRSSEARVRDIDNDNENFENNGNDFD